MHHLKNRLYHLLRWICNPAALNLFPQGHRPGGADVSFEVMNGGNVTLEVYDLNGRVIETLFSQEAQPDLEYRIHFDGSALPNGIYIYRLTTDRIVEIEKFMISK